MYLLDPIASHCSFLEQASYTTLLKGPLVHPPHFVVLEDHQDLLSVLLPSVS